MTFGQSPNQYVFQLNCCGGNDWRDYTDFAKSVPYECKSISRGSWSDWNSGNSEAVENYGNHADTYQRSYYKDGCAEKFTLWQRGWAGGTTLLTLLIAILQVFHLSPFQIAKPRATYLFFKSHLISGVFLSILAKTRFGKIKKKSI